MKHIALKSMSIVTTKPYTTPGVGDRAHSVLCAYLHAKKHNTKVTLHLTSNKYGKPHKKVSWAELCDMVHNQVEIKVHDVHSIPEHEWIAYLKEKGYDAETYHYSDTFGMHRYEKREGIDFGKYLKKLPELKALEVEDPPWLPNKYITVQWDSTDPGRRLPPQTIARIEQSYINQGYNVVPVGGAALYESLRNSLKHIGYAMAGADYHVGVDSGMMHIAQFYQPYDRLHVFRYNSTSHHFKRMIQNGSRINE